MKNMKKLVALVVAFTVGEYVAFAAASNTKINPDKLNVPLELPDHLTKLIATEWIDTGDLINYHQQSNNEANYNNQNLWKSYTKYTIEGLNSKKFEFLENKGLLSESANLRELTISLTHNNPLSDEEFAIFIKLVELLKNKASITIVNRSVFYDDVILKLSQEKDDNVWTVFLGNLIKPEHYTHLIALCQKIKMLHLCQRFDGSEFIHQALTQNPHIFEDLKNLKLDFGSSIKDTNIFAELITKSPNFEAFEEHQGTLFNNFDGVITILRSNDAQYSQALANLKNIKLSRRFDSENVDWLLTRCTNIENIESECCHGLGGSIERAIEQDANLLKQLKTVSLWKTFLNVNQLGKLTKQASNLEALKMYLNDIYQMLKLDCNALAKLKKFGSYDISFTPEEFAFFIHCCPELEEINVLHVNNSLDGIVLAIKQNPNLLKNLKTLSISIQADNDSNNLEKIINHCSNLEELIMRKSDNSVGLIHKTDFLVEQAIKNALKNLDSLKKLKKLDIEGIKINLDVLKELCHRAKKLRIEGIDAATKKELALFN